LQHTEPRVQIQPPSNNFIEIVQHRRDLNPRSQADVLPTKPGRLNIIILKGTQFVSERIILNSLKIKFCKKARLNSDKLFNLSLLLKKRDNNLNYVSMNFIFSYTYKRYIIFSQVLIITQITVSLYFLNYLQEVITIVSIFILYIKF
jgi:hypothetical protein